MTERTTVEIYETFQDFYEEGFREPLVKETDSRIHGSLELNNTGSYDGI